MARIVVLSSNSYNFKGDTGDQVSGTSIYYFDPNMPDEGNGRSGYTTVKGRLTEAMARELRAVPGVYDVDMTIRPGRNAQGQPTAEARIGRIKFVAAFPVEEMVPADV